MKLRALLAGGALALASILGFGAFAASPIPLGGSIFPLIYINQNPINLVDAFNEMESLIAQQVVGISITYPGALSVPTSGVDTSGVSFSSSIQGNPLVQYSRSDVPTDVLVSGLTSSAMTTLIASETGRSIYPLDAITIMASGTAATATGVALECSGGTFIASWPIAALVNNVPVGLYTSGTVNALGSPFANGCPSGQALMVSNVGANLTTTTHLYVNAAYSVQ